MTETPARSRRKVRLGTVVSDKMDKSIVVRVDRTVKHPLYKKPMKTSSKMYVHDENNEAGVGDTVRVMETRPISKSKRWRLLEVVEKAK